MNSFDPEHGARDGAHNPPPDLPLSCRRLLHEVGSRVTFLEEALEHIQRAEAKGMRDLQSVKANLRKKLTACYLVREGLRRGEDYQAENLNALLERVQIWVEHRRYQKFGMLSRVEIAAVDLDDLARRLQGRPG